ncbi:Uncharacterised protein [Serratia fonticola]|nr:Uncharacterised protein [Serratia fonticola]
MVIRVEITLCVDSWAEVACVRAPNVAPRAHCSQKGPGTTESLTSSSEIKTLSFDR